MRKRILSIIKVLVALSVVCCVPVRGADDPFSLLIIHENFDGASTSVNRLEGTAYGNDWRRFDNNGMVQDKGGIEGYLLKAPHTWGNPLTDSPAKVTFYVPDDDQYRIFVHVSDSSASAARVVKVTVDKGTATEYIDYFCTKSEAVPPDEDPRAGNPRPPGISFNSEGAFYWDGGEDHHFPVTLSKGKHTIDVTAITTNDSASRFDCIWIVKASDAQLFPEPLDGTNNHLQYIDKAAPIFNQEVSRTAANETSITLGWDATDQGGIGEIEIYKDDVKIATVDGTVNSYADNNLSSGSYTYRIRAIDRLGQYAESTGTFATQVDDSEPPTWQSGATLAVSGVGATSAQLSWQAAVDNKGIQRYELYNGSVSEENLLTTTANTSCTVTGLSSGTNYTVKLVAVDMGGNVTAQQLSASFTTTSIVNYVLKAENFQLPDPTSGWEIRTGDSDSGYLGYPYLFNAAATGVPMVADVYFPTDGLYNMWVNIKDFADGVRFAIADIDSFTDDSPKYGNKSNSQGWHWENGPSAKNISAGWHKILIKPGAGYMRVAAVYITNDLGSIPGGASECDQWADTTPPVMNEVSAVLTASDKIKILWEDGEDAGGIAQYKVNAESDAFSKSLTLSASDNSADISDLWELDKLSITVTAVDLFGSEGTKSIEKVVSPFDNVSLILTDQTNTPIENVSSIAGGQTVRALLGLESTSGSQRSISLGIAVYEKATGRMVGNQRTELSVEANGLLTDQFAELAVPQGFSANTHSLKLMLWDGADALTPAWESVGYITGGDEQDD